MDATLRDLGDEIDELATAVDAMGVTLPHALPPDFDEGSRKMLRADLDRAERAVRRVRRAFRELQGCADGDRVFSEDDMKAAYVNGARRALCTYLANTCGASPDNLPHDIVRSIDDTVAILADLAYNTHTD